MSRVSAPLSRACGATTRLGRKCLNLNTIIHRLQAIHPLYPMNIRPGPKAIERVFAFYSAPLCLLRLRPPWAPRSRGSGLASIASYQQEQQFSQSTSSLQLLSYLSV